MKVAIIGAGRIGATLGKLLVDAKHQVVFGLRTPTAHTELLKLLGNRATAESIEEALTADVIIFAAPYGAWPAFARENSGALAGKVLIDAANPHLERDGVVADTVLKVGHGSGAYSASLVPGARVVKAFNTIYWMDLRDQAHRSGERLGMGIAGDDVEAVSVASRLATDAGFDPVSVVA